MAAQTAFSNAVQIKGDESENAWPTDTFKFEIESERCQKHYHRDYGANNGESVFSEARGLEST